MAKVTNVEMKLRGFLEKFDTCEEDINKIESRYLNNDNGKAPDDDDDNDIKNLGIKIFCSTRRAGFVLCADSYEITGTRKLIAIVYDKNKKQIIDYKICDTGKYSDAHKFLNNYIYIKFLE